MTRTTLTALAMLALLATSATSATAKRQHVPADDWRAVCKLLRSTMQGIDPDRPIAVTLHRGEQSESEYFRCNPVRRDAGMPPVDRTVTLP